MKKALLSTVVALGVIGVGTYYGIGMKAQSSVKQLVVDANVALNQSLQMQGSPVEMKLSVANYSRGIFSSTATLDVYVKMQMPLKMPKQRGHAMPPMQLPAFTYPIPITIKHGPFIFNEGAFGISSLQASLSIPDKYQKMLKAMLTSDSVTPELHFSALTKFDGSANMSLSMPEFSLVGKMMPGKVTWQGMENDWTMSANMDKVKGTSNFKGMFYSNKGAEMTVGSADGDYDLSAALPGMWLGAMNVNLPTVDMKDRGRSMLSFGGGSITSDSDETNGLMNGSMSINLNPVKVMSREYGPGEFSFSMENFNLQPLSDLQIKANQLNQPDMTQQQAKEAFQKLMPDLIALSKTAPAIRLNQFKFQLPDGTVDVKGIASIPKGAKVAKLEDFATAIKASAQLTAPKKLVMSMATDMVAKKLRRAQYHRQMTQQVADSQNMSSRADTDTGTSNVPMRLSWQEIKEKAKVQAETQLGSLLKAGLIIEKGDDYFVDLKYEKGELTINNKPFDPGLFK